MTQPKAEELTPTVVTCYHCQNVGLMKIMGQHNNIKEYEDNRGGFSAQPLTWEAGYMYQLLLCPIPACEGVTLRRTAYHSMKEPDEWETEILYPPVKTH